MKPWAQVESDPGFQALPQPEQLKVRQAYLDRATEHPVFQGMAPEEQDKVRQRILGAPIPAPSPTVGQRIDTAAETARRALGIGADYLRAGASKALGAIAEPFNPEKATIPGLPTFNQAISESAGGVAGTVAQTLARRGHPDLAVPAGVAASILSGPGLVHLANPEAKTVGDVALLGYGAAGAEALPAAAGALAERFPVLKADIPPAGYLYNALRRKIGLPTETGLVPVNTRQAMAEGRMSVADAMRSDPEIFAEEAAKRGLTPPPAEEPAAPVAVPGEVPAVRELHIQGPEQPPATSEPVSDWRGQGGYVRLGGEAPATENTPAVKDYMSRIKDEVPKKGTDWEQQVLDENAPLKRLQDLAKNPAELPDNERLKYAIQRHGSSQLQAEQWLSDRTTSWTYDDHGNAIFKETGEGLKPILRDWDDSFFRSHGADSLRELLGYMLAQRDLETAGRGILGLDPKKAPQVIQDLQTKYGADALDAFADRIRTWEYRAFIQPLVDVGRISPEKAATIAGSNHFYIPYDRVIDDLDPTGAKGFGETLKKLEGSERDVYNPIQKMVSLAYRTSELVERTRVAQTLVRLRSESVDLAKMISEVTRDTPGAMEIPLDGKPRFFKVPAGIRESLDHLSSGQADSVNRLFSFVARIRRFGITADPQFSIFRNPIRLEQTAAMQTKLPGPAPIIPGANMVRGIFEMFGNPELYREYIASGGQASVGSVIDRLGAMQKASDLRGLREIANLNPLNWLEMVTKISHDATGLGVYSKARALGWSPYKAGEEARNVVSDLSTRPGSDFLKMWQSITAFERAIIQHNVRFYQTFKEAPAQTTYRGLALLTLPTAGLWYLNKDNKNYRDLPFAAKVGFWHLPINPADPNSRLVHIPKAWTFGLVFAGMPEAALEYMYRRDPAAVKALGEKMLHLGPPVIPSFATTGISLAANYNPATGRPIVPQSVQHLLPEDQATTFTSDTARAAGHRLGVSPAKIDYAIGDTLGTLGTRGMQAADVAANKLGFGRNRPPAPAVPLADLGLVRKPVGSNNEKVNQFYDMLDEMRREKASANARMGVAGLDLPGPPMLRVLEDAAKQIHEFRAIINLTYKAPNMTPAAKRAAIDRLEEVIANRATAAVDAVRPRPQAGQDAAIVQLIQRGKTDQAYDAFNAMPNDAARAFIQQLGVSEAGRAIKARLLLEHQRREAETAGASQ